MQLKSVLFLEQLPYWTFKLRGWSMWALSGWQVLAWIVFLFGYSLFIPNTWRRAAVILSVVASIPVVMHGAVCLFDPEVKGVQAGVLMLATTVTMAFVAALSIFGAHRIDTLRRAVHAARRLGQYQLGERLGTGGMGEVYR